MASPLSPPAQNIGQVCDRCRAKKIKCNGATPSCGNCTSAGAACVVSAKLRRKSKPRGFQAISAEEGRLRAENEALKTTLRSERNLNESLQRRIEELSHPSPSTQKPSTYPPPSHLIGHQPQKLKTDKSGPVVKHMGRLLLDNEGLERFAGSTTGVHFIYSVQQLLQKRGLVTDGFPESCYRLYLFPPVQNLVVQLPCWFRGDDDNQGLFGHLKIAFDRPIVFYTRQISNFNQSWYSLCPLVIESDLIRSIIEAQQFLRQGQSPNSMSSCLQMLVIILINAATSAINLFEADEMAGYTKLIFAMIPHLVTKGDTASLEGLALVSMYLLVTGETLQLSHINGVLVRNAQNLGLHRHSRRFKFSPGQTEIRKRLWWYIYIFDKMTSIRLGLPQLIQDMDVDTDYPIDCELEEVDSPHITFPLPGETTRTLEFVATIQLTQILAETLKLLYTTTRRRQGLEKIAKLHQDLLSWRHQFQAEGDEVGVEISSKAPSRIYLDILDNFTMILIHRPGLTFELQTRGFVESLSECVQACSKLITILSSLDEKNEILRIAPLGPSALFQCGLMHIFDHAIASEYECQRDSLPLENRRDLIQRAAEALLQISGTNSATAQVESSHSFVNASSEASQLLRSLDRLVLNSPAELTNSLDTEHLGFPAEFTNIAEGDLAPDFGSMNVATDLGSLENLNYFNFMYTTPDNPFGDIF